MERDGLVATMVCLLTGGLWSCHTPPLPPEVTIDAVAFLTEYAEAPVKADIKYRGRRIALTGMAGRSVDRQGGTAFIEMVWGAKTGRSAARCNVPAGRARLT
jgi:hypothetical protein